MKDFRLQLCSSLRFLNVFDTESFLDWHRLTHGHNAFNSGSVTQLTGAFLFPFPGVYARPALALYLQGVLDAGPWAT